MISVISRHLPLTRNFLEEPYYSKSFELLHLVESARYHQTNFLSLTKGIGKAPEGFDSGINITSDELDSYWRMMALVIEFEGFLFSSKRFLDGAWVFFRPKLKEEMSEKDFSDTDTLGRAIKLFDSKQELQSYPYITNLMNCWNDWGKDLTDLRNYTEHESPLGGNGFGYTILNADNTNHYLVLPEAIHKNGKRIPKEHLSYNSSILASEYVSKHIEKIDSTLVQLIQSFNQPKLNAS